MKEHSELIEITRREIMKLQDQQNVLYEQMVKIINPSDSSEPWLWEYCFNCSDNRDEYTQRVEKEIYGN